MEATGALKKQIIRRCSTVAVCVIALLLFVTVGWKALGSVISSISNNKAKTEENTVVQAAAARKMKVRRWQRYLQMVRRSPVMILGMADG